LIILKEEELILDEVVLYEVIFLKVFLGNLCYLLSGHISMCLRDVNSSF